MFVPADFGNINVLNSQNDCITLEIVFVMFGENSTTVLITTINYDCDTLMMALSRFLHVIEKKIHTNLSFYLLAIGEIQYEPENDWLP